MTEFEISIYFKDFIFGFIFNDIQKGINSGSNYLVALGLLSYTEYMGGLIKGTLGVRKGSSKRFKAALEYFEWKGDSNTYKEFKVEYVDEKDIKKPGTIYDLFRCGLAHEYFVKGDSFVHNNPGGYIDKDTGVFYCEGCIPENVGVQIVNGQLRFHTNAFFRDFKNAWVKYYYDLIEGPRKEEMQEIFNKAMERINSRRLIIESA